MKKNAVMLADTRPALVGTVLLQLKRTNPGLFDEAIIYYIDPIRESDRELMCSIIPCKFVHYDPPIPDYLFEKPRFKRFSALMFCRYEMFAYLDEFETVTWLDTDILIQKNLSEMIEIAKKTGAAFIREDPINKTAERTDYMRTCFSRSVPGFQMDAYLYCSGTIVLSQKILISQKLNGAMCTSWCYQKTVQWANILELPDQGVLNAAIQHFSIKIGLLKGKEYCCYPSLGRDCSDAMIIHAWGSNKFWNDWYAYVNFPAWKSYYEKWMDMGGSSLGFVIRPAISIIIPSYKPDLTMFKQCLDSLMAQCRDSWERYSDFEIIIVAEPFEQTDLKAMVESYHDDRIHLEFNPTRLGIASSLNRGMRLATGRYIARMDDDDICHEARLFLQAKYLDENPEVTLCTSDFEYFGDMNEWRLSFEGNMSFAWSIFTCPFDHPTIMFRKDFFLENELFYDEQRGYVEDWELWRRAFRKGMNVGCIHKVLFYHRWINNISAGQSNKTVVMMRELVQKNFAELGVIIPAEHLWMVGPWNGRLLNTEDIERIQGYFQEALKNNEELKIYDQDCLDMAFQLRLSEAQIGTLPGLSRKIQREEQKENNREFMAEVTNKKRKRLFALIIKRFLKPLYRPFRHRYEDRIINIQDAVWRVEGHVLNCITKLDQIISEQNRQLESLAQRTEEIIEENAKIQYQLLIQERKRQQDCEFIRKIIYDATENASQALSASMCTEAENTRQKLSAKIYTEAENTRQELSAKMSEQLDYNGQELAAKAYESQEQLREEVHRHIDFTYRDVMVALERQKAYLPTVNIRLITEHPIACKSLDHLYPRGTIRDNTRYPRFVEKCEEILHAKENLSFLDLGCSGGGMVLEAALRGHISMGLEGSDCSKKEQRAEWRLLGDRLLTCDITKPFRLVNEKEEIHLFNIITAWEVLEHIAQEDIPQLLKNILAHLAANGLFVASIANWADIDPVSGVNWHVTCHPYDWWKRQFERAGFVVCSELFAPIDLARGGYNPPHCYEMPYPELDVSRTFHIVARKR